MDSNRLASLACEIQNIDFDIGNLESLLKNGVKNVTLSGDFGDITISNYECPSGFEKLKEFISECIESCNEQKDLKKQEIIKEVSK